MGAASSPFHLSKLLPDILHSAPSLLLYPPSFEMVDTSTWLARYALSLSLSLSSSAWKMLSENKWTFKLLPETLVYSTYLMRSSSRFCKWLPSFADNVTFRLYTRACTFYKGIYKNESNLRWIKLMLRMYFSFILKSICI